MKIRITQDCEIVAGFLNQEPMNFFLKKGRVLSGKVTDVVNVFGQKLDCIDIVNSRFGYAGIPNNCYEKVGE